LVSSSDDASYDSVIVSGKNGKLPTGNADTVDVSHAWTITSASATIATGSKVSDTLTVPAKSTIVGLVVPVSLSDSIFMDVSYTARTGLSSLHSSAGAKQYFISDTSNERTFYVSESTSIGLVRYVCFRSTDATWKARTITVIYKRD
jgi:CRISPR/Cas system-associated protein Cas5 (RAMP superfamily)